MSFDATNKPFWQPPDYVFGPVWTFLYLTMAGSLITAINNREEIPLIAFGLFSIQLALNVFWPPIFDRSDYLLAFVLLLVMVSATLTYALLVFKASPISTYLIIPYLLWISFATSINAWYVLEG
jgi:benzodiazapine receptor